ncbi:four helix bundle protein [Candidatus Collierbacteria bacterium]|nr:four helix bundle protein [Candidatus Collierbacteria bacterium]
MQSVWKENIILRKASSLAHLVYQIIKTFPTSERFGLTSQLNRAIVSVILNMIEGYSRFSRTEHARFLEMSFASLKESQYLIEFCTEEGFIKEDNSRELLSQSEEISRMLYAKIMTMRIGR